MAKQGQLYLKDQKGNLVLHRKMLAQYTSSLREIKQMNDIEFLDYATFLLRQQNVHAAEGAKDAIQTTRNVVQNPKSMKTYRQFVEVSKTAMVVLLIGAFVIILIVIPAYAIIFKYDVVKRSINYHMFPMTLYLIAIFAFFLFLFIAMNSLIQKILSLM